MIGPHTLANSCVFLGGNSVGGGVCERTRGREDYLVCPRTWKGFPGKVRQKDYCCISLKVERCGLWWWGGECQTDLVALSKQINLWLGGRGANKALGRVLLEQNVDRQTCQREAVNDMFSEHCSLLRTHTVSELKSLCITCHLFFPEFYSSEVGVDDCSEACHITEKCVCSKCKCCTSCSNKCNCIFANAGADASLARQLLPSISEEYL